MQIILTTLINPEKLFPILQYSNTPVPQHSYILHVNIVHIATDIPITNSLDSHPRPFYNSNAADNEKNDNMVDSAMAAEASSVSLLSWDERIYDDGEVGNAK